MKYEISHSALECISLMLQDIEASRRVKRLTYHRKNSHDDIKTFKQDNSKSNQKGFTDDFKNDKADF